MGKIAAVISSEQALLEISEDGNTWLEIPGSSSWSMSGGDPETRQTIMFRGTRQKAGAAQAGTIDCEFASYLPHHPAVQDLQEAFALSKKIRMRLTTEEDEILDSGAGNTCAIAAATGICTFAGSPANADFAGDDYGPGHVIEIAGNPYTIISISDAGVVTVTKPAANVGAAVYKILVPSLRLGGDNGLLVGVGAPGPTLGSQADLAGGVQFFPDRPLRKTDWTIV